MYKASFTLSFKPILVSSSICYYHTTAGIASERDVRLVGSPMNGMGAVEIYTSPRWISVCPDNAVWSNSTANATCVQLGYESGQTMTFT